MYAVLHELRNLALVLLIPLSVITQNPVLPVPISAAHGDYASRIATGEGTRYLACRGEGSPTVLLESDASLMTTDAWSSVENAVSRFTRVCSYDRANVGRSGPAPMPRTARQMAVDFAGMLETANVPAPYLLVSFGFGSLVSRLYASAHPDNVAGMLLIDPLSEEMETRWQAVLPPALQADLAAAFWNGNPEGIDFAGSYAELGAAGPLPVVPLIVLTHNPANPTGLIPAGWPAAQLDAIWQELARAQAKLVPGGSSVVAKTGDHAIPQLEPDRIALLIRAIIWPPMTPMV